MKVEGKEGRRKIKDLCVTFCEVIRSEVEGILTQLCK